MDDNNFVSLIDTQLDSLNSCSGLILTLSFFLFAQLPSQKETSSLFGLEIKKTLFYKFGASIHVILILYYFRILFTIKKLLIGYTTCESYNSKTLNYALSSLYTNQSPLNPYYGADYQSYQITSLVESTFLLCSSLLTALCISLLLPNLLLSWIGNSAKHMINARNSMEIINKEHQSFNLIPEDKFEKLSKNKQRDYMKKINDWKPKAKGHMDQINNNITSLDKLKDTLGLTVLLSILYLTFSCTMLFLVDPRGLLKTAEAHPSPFWIRIVSFLAISTIGFVKIANNRQVSKWLFERFGYYTNTSN